MGFTIDNSYVAIILDVGIVIISFFAMLYNIYKVRYIKSMKKTALYYIEGNDIVSKVGVWASLIILLIILSGLYFNYKNVPIVALILAIIIFTQIDRSQRMVVIDEKNIYTIMTTTELKSIDHFYVKDTSGKNKAKIDVIQMYLSNGTYRTIYSKMSNGLINKLKELPFKIEYEIPVQRAKKEAKR